jgi:hypothetical protein
MASDDIAYTRNESEDFLLAVPAEDLTVAQVEAMEPIVRHELEAYIERGGDGWTATPKAPKPIDWPPIIVVEVIDEPSPATVKGAVGRVEATKTEGAKVDG